MLKPGYKQTEWGVVPEDWLEMRLGENLHFQVGFPFASEFFNKKQDGIRLIKNRDLKADDDIHYYSGSFHSNFLVKNGDVLIGMDGDFMPCIWNKGKALLNQRVGRIKVNNKLDLQFLFYFLLEPLKEIEQSTGSTTVKHLSHGQVENIFRCIPPPAEQQAIAETLGAVDALLTAQRELLAKKRDLKQATQQALLSGEQRLPGFGGEWEEKTLGDCFDKVIGGGTPSRGVERFWGGPIPWVTVKDLSSFDAYKAQESITVEALRSSASHLIPKGTLIISTRMAVGRAVIYAVDVAINQDLKALYTNSSADRYFIYYWLQLEEENIASGATGSTVKGLQVGDLKALVINLPPIAEQRAIAAILSDMDAELEALAAQLAKTQALKQGLMQDLLTGRLRLGQGGAAPTVPFAV
jgi:type I restriction enzyme S subunit